MRATFFMSDEKLIKAVVALGEESSTGPLLSLLLGQWPVLSGFKAPHELKTALCADTKYKQRTNRTPSLARALEAPGENIFLHKCHN